MPIQAIDDKGANKPDHSLLFYCGIPFQWHKNCNYNWLTEVVVSIFVEKSL